MRPTIYLDNAASTPIAPSVFEAMVPYLVENFGNPSSIHAFGRRLRAALEQARKTIAERMGCSPGEIFFTSGGTEADNVPLRNGIAGLGVRRIITSPIEHHAVLHTAEYLRSRFPIDVVYLSVDEKGRIALDELEKTLSDGVPTLVSLMHVNNEVGVVYAPEEIGEICKRRGAWYHSDTVQSVGKYSFVLGKTPVDFIAASAHKFGGPKGIGFLYVRGGVNLPPLLTGGGQERNMRAGTENVAGAVGMARALEIAYQDRSAKNEYLSSLKQYFSEKLKLIVPSLEINGEIANDFAPHILNVAFPGEDTESLLLLRLDMEGVAASGGSACASGAVLPSHVLTAMGASVTRAANSVRFSFGPQNTFVELDAALAVIQNVFEKETRLV